MKKTDLGQTVQIVANIGVIGGIILLAYEVNQNSDAIRLPAAQSNLDTFYALDLLIAEGGIEDQSCLLHGRLQCVSRRSGGIHG
jgi:hypothetical protein